MNKKIKQISLLLISFLAIFILLSYFNLGIVDVVKKEEKIKDFYVSFSKESGFYNEPIYVELIANKESKIYYTLDCSNPDENSIEYTEPIYLENASSNANVYSMNTDVTTGFYYEYIEKYGYSDSIPDYKIPDYNIDKCNVIRAIAIDENGNKTEIVTSSYYVGIDIANYENCNIISIVTDPENLFDDEIGIYVVGNSFDDSNLSDDPEEDDVHIKNWEFWSANYTQRGKEWEREASFESFEKIENNYINNCSQNIGIRIQGGISRGTLPKSLNLFARNKYGSSSFPNYFNDNLNPTKITLSAGGNKLITKINDYLISEAIGNDLDISTMIYKPCILFLDGEFWGFYLISSSYDENYLNYYYGVDKNNIIMFKKNSIEIGNEDDIRYYNQMYSAITTSDLSNQFEYESIKKYIDIDSCIDYYSMMIYIARQNDWPNRNFAMWRSKVKGEGYSDQKFRYMVYDCNSLCMEYELIDHDTLSYVIEKDLLFASLWNNEEFREKFKTKILELSNTCFLPNNINSIIDNYTSKYLDSLSSTWDRFYGLDNNKYDEYFSEIQSIKDFFAKRKEVVESWFN